MYDSGKIIIGLIIFVGLFTSPIWYDLSHGKEALAEPNLILPSKENQKECIQSTNYMRSYHMEMLNDWRNEVVREGKRQFVSSTGKTYNMSLTNTCLNCHSNKAQFCDQCHNYVGVSPYCWECHLEPHNAENK
jgi:hypothetical protein